MKIGRDSRQPVLFPKSTDSSKKGGVRKRGKAPQLTREQKVDFLTWTTGTWWPTRNMVVALLSFECGLRPIEIARAEWGMAFDPTWRLRPRLRLHNFATKGGYGARDLRISPATLGVALEQLLDERPPMGARQLMIEFRKGGVDEYDRSRRVQEFFRAGYDALGLDEHSSYSGRRTAITQLYLLKGQREAQVFAGHRSAATTAGYIDVDQLSIDRVIDEHLAVRLPRVLKMAKASVSDRTPRVADSFRRSRGIA